MQHRFSFSLASPSRWRWLTGFAASWRQLATAVIVRFQAWRRLHGSPVEEQSLSLCLREPCTRVRQQRHDHIRFQRAVERIRHLPQSTAFLHQYGSKWHFPQRQAFDELLRSDRRPRIIATFHFGDFTYGIHYLMSGMAAQRPRYFLTLAPCLPATYSNVRHAFGDSVAAVDSELLLGEHSLRSLSAKLRVAGGNLVLFCDLPPQFGERIEVDFLQRPASFPRGPATLSIVNRVPILPVLCCYGPEGPTVICGQQIEPRHNPPRDREASVRLITQQLVDFFAPHFSQNPAQWRYLECLPDYFLAARNA